jgi:hypothetical protein
MVVAVHVGRSQSDVHTELVTCTARGTLKSHVVNENYKRERN